MTSDLVSNKGMKLDVLCFFKILGALCPDTDALQWKNEKKNHSVEKKSSSYMKSLEQT